MGLRRPWELRREPTPMTREQAQSRLKRILTTTFVRVPSLAVLKCSRAPHWIYYFELGLGGTRPPLSLSLSLCTRRSGHVVRFQMFTALWDCTQGVGMP